MKFSLVVIVAALLGSCGKSSSNAGAGSSASELEGVWQTECLVLTTDLTASTYFKIFATYTGNTEKVDQVIYSSDNCSVSTQSTTQTSTFTIGDALTTIAGAKKIDSVTQTLTLMLKDAASVTAANTAPLYYGYSDWVLNTSKDIAGKKATDSDEAENAVGVINYDIFKIDGTKLSLGDNDTGTGTSDATRPTALDTTLTVTKQESTTTAAGTCASSVVAGSWKGSISGNSDTMAFNSDCSGSSTYCKSTFTYPNITASSGSVLITNTSTNGATGCLAAGAFTCTYAISGSTLTFGCGGGTVSYTK